MIYLPYKMYEDIDLEYIPDPELCTMLSTVDLPTLYSVRSGNTSQTLSTSYRVQDTARRCVTTITSRASDPPYNLYGSPDTIPYSVVAEYTNLLALDNVSVTIVNMEEVQQAYYRFQDIPDLQLIFTTVDLLIAYFRLCVVWGQPPASPGQGHRLAVTVVPNGGFAICAISDHTIFTSILTPEILELLNTYQVADTMVLYTEYPQYITAPDPVNMTVVRHPGYRKFSPELLTFASRNNTLLPLTHINSGIIVNQPEVIHYAITIILLNGDEQDCSFLRYNAYVRSYFQLNSNPYMCVTGEGKTATVQVRSQAIYDISQRYVHPLANLGEVFEVYLDQDRVHRVQEDLDGLSYGL